MTKHGKRLTDVYKALGDDRSNYALKDAIRFMKEHANCKFDETVDCTLVLGVDVRKTDQQLRGVFQPPHGLGKAVRVAVFASGDKIGEAKAAGADLVGDDDLVDQVLSDKKIDADVCIATPDMMASVGKLGRLLGSRGLLPNPKLGTVTNDLARVIEDSKKGRVEYRVDRTGVMRVGIAKVSFSLESIFDNIKGFLNTIIGARPAGVKGTFLKKAYISSTMGASFELDLKAFASEEGVSC